MAGFFFFPAADKDVTATDLRGRQEAAFWKKPGEDGGPRLHSVDHGELDGTVFTDLNGIAGCSGYLYSGCLGD